MNNISNKKHIRNLNYLVDSTSNSKQFCLHRHNINSIVNSFDNCIVT